MNLNMLVWQLKMRDSLTGFAATCSGSFSTYKESYGQTFQTCYSFTKEISWKQRNFNCHSHTEILKSRSVYV